MDADEQKWNATADAGQWLVSQHLATATSKTDFRIDGWLAATGTSVWFGAGSTGKTQLLLWMAATIASTERPARWLGREVGGTGHVLILTAEDSREHVIGRLRDVVVNALNQDEQTASRTCSRLHVMPFLNMTEEEFKHPSASLMQLGADRIWQPTPVLLEIRRYIEVWNQSHSGDDRIVGVVMDSATSMAGFDTIDGHATTNFFFYLGRLCEALGIFWTVIGHQPKSVSIGKDTRNNAAARLRGAAMWTTAPRMTVEVRLIQEWNKQREAGHIRAAHPDRRKEDFVVVYVAKANLPGVHTDERYLLRSPEGAFLDVTTAPPVVTRSETAKNGTASGDGAPAMSAGNKGERHWERGTALVLATLREAYPDVKSGTIIAANKALEHCRSQFADHADVELVQSAYGGGATAARPGAINWHLDQLVERGILEWRGRRFRFVGWPDNDVITADQPAAIE